ncbi:MAG: hypothetical protein LBR08_12055 [Bacteroidales bacterium]|nr:hypothetical protein [Bacteroidales bacterium]
MIPFSHILSAGWLPEDTKNRSVAIAVSIDQRGLQQFGTIFAEREREREREM